MARSSRLAPRAQEGLLRQLIQLAAQELAGEVDRRAIAQPLIERLLDHRFDAASVKGDLPRTVQPEPHVEIEILAFIAGQQIVITAHRIEILTPDETASTQRIAHGGREDRKRLVACGKPDSAKEIVGHDDVRIKERQHPARSRRRAAIARMGHAEQRTIGNRDDFHGGIFAAHERRGVLGAIVIDHDDFRIALHHEARERSLEIVEPALAGRHDRICRRWRSGHRRAHRKAPARRRNSARTADLNPEIAKCRDFRSAMRLTSSPMCRPSSIVPLRQGSRNAIFFIRGASFSVERGDPAHRLAVAGFRCHDPFVLLMYAGCGRAGQSHLARVTARARNGSGASHGHPTEAGGEMQ